MYVTTSRRRATQRKVPLSGDSRAANVSVTMVTCCVTIATAPPFLFSSRKKHGRALVLDNIIQCTEFDEFAYQEMIAFLPLCAHTSPAEVLIIGGGDGGVAREVVKHPLVQHVTQVEIDDRVIAASKKYLPFMSSGFNNAKLNLIVGDGFAYMDQQRGKFDVIITDSSDPVGPAANLFTENYFKLLSNALRPGGIICSQGGCIWTGLKEVKATVDAARKYFSNVKYALVSVPTYPCGQIGLLIATNDKIDLTHARHLVEDKSLRYYHGDAHKAAFTLPKFAADQLLPSINNNIV